MRPHRLRVTAFGAFGGTVEVSFDDLASAGLFLLHGDTGAGKTTLLDAIGFALYGRVPGERGKARRLRSDHAAAGACGLPVSRNRNASSFAAPGPPPSRPRSSSRSPTAGRGGPSRPGRVR